MDDVEVLFYAESAVSKGGETYAGTVVLNDLAYPAKFAAKGLPAGLKIDAATGDEGADAQERVPPEGLVTLTVAANGKISGKVISADGTWTLSAAAYSRVELLGQLEPLESLEPRLAYYATVIGKNGKKAITNEVTVSAGEMAGTRDACPYQGTVTLKFAASGAVTASGKFVTGQDARGRDVVYSASCSSVLVPEADAGARDARPYRIFLYFPPKAGRFDGYTDEIQLVWDGTTFKEE